MLGGHGPGSQESRTPYFELQNMVRSSSMGNGKEVHNSDDKELKQVRCFSFSSYISLPGLTSHHVLWFLVLISCHLASPSQWPLRTHTQGHFILRNPLSISAWISLPTQCFSVKRERSRTCLLSLFTDAITAWESFTSRRPFWAVHLFCTH